MIIYLNDCGLVDNLYKEICPMSKAQSQLYKNFHYAKLISAYKVLSLYANAEYIKFSTGNLLACLFMFNILGMSQIPSLMCVILCCIVPQNRWVYGVLQRSMYLSNFSISQSPQFLFPMARKPTICSSIYNHHEPFRFQLHF